MDEDEPSPLDNTLTLTDSSEEIETPQSAEVATSTFTSDADVGFHRPSQENTAALASVLQFAQAVEGQPMPKTK